MPVITCAETPETPIAFICAGWFQKTAGEATGAGATGAGASVIGAG